LNTLTAARLAQHHLHGCAVPPLGGTGPFLQLSLTFRFILELSMDQGQSLKMALWRSVGLCGWLNVCGKVNMCVLQVVLEIFYFPLQVVITSSSHS